MNFKSLLHYLNRRDHRLLPQKSIITKIIFILAICFITIFPIKNALADTVSKTTTITLPPNTLETEISDKQTSLEDGNINNENWTKEYNLTNALIGVNILSGTNISTAFKGDSSWVPQGFIGYTSNAIASFYKPPASGVQYIADSVNSFLGKPIYADDGFTQLTALQPLWKICRNTVYTLISIFFVTIGLMIMLRIKISPQATITIQNSIPKIITTLILVTFSYAISGLIIDISYLFQAVILSMITKIDPTRIGILSDVPELSELIQASWDTFTQLGKNNMWKIFLSGPGITTSVITTIIGGIIGALAAPGVNSAIVLGLIGAVVGALIILLFISWQLVKFFFGCAKAYLLLLLKIISAPLEIALGAFPNSKTGFNTWFIQTISYAAVFPVCLIFLVILNIVMNAISLTETWVPGVLQGSILSIVLRPLIGLVGLTLLSKLPDLIPQTISKAKASPFGKAIGEGVAPVVGFYRGGGRIVTGAVRTSISTNITQRNAENPLIKRWLHTDTKNPDKTLVRGAAQNTNTPPDSDSKGANST